jgi:spore maturation protein CgeB
MAGEADLYLGNDVRNENYKGMLSNSYYFPFDVADKNMLGNSKADKKYDVTFFGSCIGQGDRIQYLTSLKDYISLKIFAWNYQDWISRGFDAEPAVYGKEFANKVSESKIVLGFSVNPNTWGYWSNRVGKTLLAGGFLLYQYAPGMELLLGDSVEYFSSIEEMKEKIDFYLIADVEREQIALNGMLTGLNKFSSFARVEELMILTERYLKKGDVVWHF